jgi:predicted nucleotidyltransferase
MKLAETLNDPALVGSLKEELAAGVSFAAARQKAVARLLTAEQAALLENPNNILGVEYCKSIHRHGFAMEPLTVKRKGDAHDSAQVGDAAAPSASAIRRLLREGGREDALALMTPEMEIAYLAEEKQGRAPVFLETCERAVLAKLRSMTAEDFAALDEGREGLCNRLYEASRRATSVAEILELAKTKRYAYSRLRRMLLWAYLGLEPKKFPAEPLYIRPLAANATGRQLLGMMRKSAAVPVLTKPGEVRRMSVEAQQLFELEARGADLYALAYPDLSAAEGDSIWREGPAIL